MSQKATSSSTRCTSGNSNKTTVSGRSPIALRIDGHELGDIRDVLERVSAHDDVGVEVGVALVVEVGDPLDLRSELVVVPALGVHARIDADAMTGAGLGHLDQELALATPDLEHRLVGEVVVLDPLLGQIGGERHEARREALRLLVPLRVLGLARRERSVGDEATRVAERDLQLAAGELAGLVRIVEQQTAVGGNVALFEEDGEVGLPTCRAGLIDGTVRRRAAGGEGFTGTRCVGHDVDALRRCVGRERAR